MNKGWIKYTVLIVVVSLLAYNSVYFKKLDAPSTGTVETTADPAAFAEKFWKVQFVPYLDSAVEITSLLKLLNTDAKKAIATYSKTQGIGNTAYFLVNGTGLVTAVNDEYITLSVKSADDIIPVKLNTGIYFGNAVRDVSGKISMGDFGNTMDYNTVSSTLNKIVQTQVIKPFKKTSVKGASIQFVACAEINTERIDADNIQLLPVKIIPSTVAAH
jgi:predicted lipoprotein